MTARKNKVLLLLLAAVCFCCLLCGISFFGGNTTAYAYSSSVRYKLDVTATGAEGIYLYVNGASGSGTITDGAALNYAPDRVDVVLNKRTKLGRFYYTKYVKDFELSGPTSYSKSDRTSNSSRSSTKTVTYTLPSLSDGKYTLKITTGSDYSGVVGDTSSKITFTFYVDRSAPTISGASTSTTGKYATSSFTVRASDSVSGVESLYVKAPNSSYYSSVGSSSKTISSGSANGLYSFYAYDKAQNKSKTYYVYFDSTKPVGTLKTSVGTVSSGSYTSQSFSYTASDSGSGIKTLQYKTPGSSTWKTYTSGTTISSTSTNGWYYFRAQDKSGLYSDESKICLDTGKPTGTLYGGTKIAASGSTVTSEYVKFTAADDLSGISKVYVKKPGAVGYAVISNSSQFTANGTYSFYCADVAGNRSADYMITLDNTSPELICEGAEFGSIAEQSFTVTARDAGGKATLYYRYEFGEWQTSGDSCTISDKQQDGRYYFYAVDEQNNKSAELWVLFNAAELAGRFVQSDVDNRVYFTWDSDYWTATLDGEAYHKGTWICDEGDHTIVLSNGVGKSATYNFTIDHDYVVSKTVSPTCTEQGYTIYVCSSCGETKREDFCCRDRT